MQALAASQSTPSQQAARREESVLLAEALDRLPADYREVIVLRQLEELSFPEVAQRMGKSVGGVKQFRLVDADGNPTTDPNKARILLPFGGYKASSLALMFETLSSVMAGNGLLTPFLLGGERPRPGAQNSVVAAIDIADRVRRFNETPRPLRLPTRIGLHAGDMFLGSVGAFNHYEYRPTGDMVNTASRIEGLNKYLGTGILASEEVSDQLAGFVFRELGQFLLAGKSKPVLIRELICRDGECGEADRRIPFRGCPRRGA